MTWTEKWGDTWEAEGYRIHLHIRDFSCWATGPMRHLGLAQSLDAGKALCETHREESNEKKH